MIYTIVGAAGIAGSLLRYLVGAAMARWEPSLFPWATFTVNLSGCLLLGWLLTSLSFRQSPHPWIKAGIGTGFIGSFTTFSAFSMETVRLVTERQRWDIALVYVLLSIWGGLAMAWLGHRSAERMCAPAAEDYRR